MINIQMLQGIVKDSQDPAAGGPLLDFRDPANINQDFAGLADRVGQMARDKWGVMAGRGDALAAGIRTDAQIASFASCGLVHTLAGFYRKPSRKKVWANGEYITLTDSGATAGDKKIEWEMRGRRHNSVDDGITAPDRSPERAIGIATETKDARLVPVKHKIEIGWFGIQQAARRGFDKFEADGVDLRDQHLWDINNIIRRGNVKYGLRGITNYPGIRHRVAAVDWGSANADVIYDDYNAALNQVYASETEEDLPALGILPRLQFRHIETENFGAGTDTTLKTYIETNNGGHRIVEDPGLRNADQLGNPGAIFMTPRRDLVFVTVPVFAQVMPPHNESPWVITLEIMSYIAGVQVADTDTILIVDGSSAGWQKTA